MNMHSVWCRFEPDHVNLPAGRRGQWRVVDSKPLTHKRERHVMRFGRDLVLTSTKPYPKGSIIRPHRELNRVLAARRKGMYE